MKGKKKVKKTKRNVSEKKSRDFKKVDKKKETNKLSILIGLGIVAILIIAAIYLLSPKQENSDEILVIVNDQSITLSKVQDMKESVSKQGYNITQEEIIEELIILELLKQEAEKEGYIKNFQEAEEQMSSQLEMQGLDVEFLKEQLENQNISYEDYVTDYIEMIAIQEYLSNKIKGLTKEPTEEEIQEFYEQFKGTYIEESAELDSVKEEIKNYLFQMQENDLIYEVIEELNKTAEIEYLAPSNNQ